MCGGTRSLLWVSPNKLYNRRCLLPHAPTQIGPETLSRCMRNVAFQPLITVHSLTDKSINKLPALRMSQCWLSQKKMLRCKSKLSRGANHKFCSFVSLSLLHFPVNYAINNLRISQTPFANVNVSCLVKIKLHHKAHNTTHGNISWLIYNAS